MIIVFVDKWNNNKFVCLVWWTFSAIRDTMVRLGVLTSVNIQLTIESTIGVTIIFLTFEWSPLSADYQNKTIIVAK